MRIRFIRLIKVCPSYPKLHVKQERSVIRRRTYYNSESYSNLQDFHSWTWSSRLHTVHHNGLYFPYVSLICPLRSAGTIYIYNHNFDWFEIGFELNHVFMCVYTHIQGTHVHRCICMQSNYNCCIKL